MVINVVNHSMVEQVSLASSEFPKEINEFQKAGLTEIASEKVRPPRVGESPVSFECTVQEVIALGAEGGAGNLVISEVKLLHIHSQYLDTQGKLDTTKLDLVGRMGGNWYTRASGKSLFQVEKPARPLGIGIDWLPESIRNSTVLSGNNLARLGNMPNLPDNQEIQDWKKNPDNMALYHEPNLMEQLHLAAKQMIEKDKVQQALLVLMVADSL